MFSLQILPFLAHSLRSQVSNLSIIKTRHCCKKVSTSQFFLHIVPTISCIIKKTRACHSWRGCDVTFVFGFLRHIYVVRQCTTCTCSNRDVFCYWAPISSDHWKIQLPLAVSIGIHSSHWLCPLEYTAPIGCVHWYPQLLLSLTIGISNSYWL